MSRILPGWYTSPNRAALDAAAGPSYDSATTAWVSAVVTAGGTVSDTQKGYVDTLVTGLKNDSLWTKISRLWIFGAENTYQANIDLVARASVAALIHGTVTFTANSGYTGDGTSGVIDSGYNPSNDGTIFLKDSCSIGAYVINDRTSGDSSKICGSYDGSNHIELKPFVAGPNYYVGLNAPDNNYYTASLTTTKGLMSASRPSSTTVNLYKNGSQLTSISRTSVAIPNLNIAILGGVDYVSTLFGEYSSDTVGLVFFGGAFSDADMSNCYTRAFNYLHAIGAV